ncbi:MAG: bifunctional oligoribonuclease/PAP phosphatase NrnA [Chloroflexi bacterium]|nr:bifunctional oligoribonuclease/PAP phosphatase NrnA [Chloroflexota bacterium]
MVNDGETQVEMIRDRLKAAQRVLIVSHIRPDGDAIGSVLGFGLALQEAGKEVQMVSPDGVPSALKRVPDSDKIVSKAEGNFDLVTVVDCSDLTRVGAALDGLGVPHLNIDHHVTNLEFAQINVIDTRAAATAEMLAEYLPEWGLEISQPVATALLVGLLADTIGFRTTSTTAKTLRAAAEMVERGANLGELYGRVLAERSFEAVKFWGAGLAQLEREGALVWTTLSQQDRMAAGYTGRDDADLINVLSAIYGIQIAIIFVEQANGHVKVSWRSRPGVDVSALALSMGGGGHPSAAGVDIPGSLESVREKVLEETRKLVKERVML